MPPPSRTSWQALVLWLVLIALLAIGGVTLWRHATIDATGAPASAAPAPAVPATPSADVLPDTSASTPR